MKQTTRFSNNGSTMAVLARTGKTGISVFVRVKNAGQRAVIGCRNVFLPANEEQAKAKHAELVAEAARKGWTPKSGGGGRSNVSAFSEIPLPTAVPQGAPMPEKAAKAEKPKPVAVAGGKRR